MTSDRHSDWVFERSAEWEVGSQLSGRVEKLLVDFNDKVKAGQPLAVLERDSFPGEVAPSRGSTGSRKSRSPRCRSTARARQIGREGSGVNLRMAALRLESARIPALIASREAERKLQLNQRGVGALSDFQDLLMSRRQAAAANVKEAEENLAAQLTAIESSLADLKRAEAERTNAQALLARFEAEVEGARID